MFDEHWQNLMNNEQFISEEIYLLTPLAKLLR